MFNPSSTVYRRCTGFIFGWLMWSVHLTHCIYFYLFYLIFFFFFWLAHWTVCYWLTSLCHIPGSHIPGRVFFSAAPQLLHWSVISKNGNFNLCLFINFFFFLLWHLAVCYWLTSLCHIPGSHIPGSHIPGWVFFCTAPQLLHWPVISKKADFN